MDTNKSNPLYGVSIGSTISTNGKLSLPSVVEEPISKMISQQESYKYMSGTSSYVYSDKMNQGSLGLSGSYGISGISLLKASLSTYIGNSSARSSKSICINYNALSVGGIEYINFEGLKVKSLLAGLNSACRQGLESVLERYNKVVAETSNLGVSLIKAFQSKDKKYENLKKLANQWIKESESFTRDFGSGLVVGVTWGAYGGLNMSMTSKSEESSWKYGGQGDFSYSRIGASVSVKAAYDGNQSNSNADIDVECTNYVNGSILTSQVDEWFRLVSDKSFEELADVKILDKAPNMDITQGAPSIPEFIEPKPEKDTEDKVEKSAGSAFDSAAKISAYSQAKKEDENLEFDQFLHKSRERANTEGLSRLKKAISENSIDTLADIDKQTSFEDNLKIQSLVAVGEEKPNTEGYVPLGVWISNWEDLFPWMSRGYCNSIENREGEDTMRAMVMLQDYQTLSKLYYMAHSSGVPKFKRKDPSQAEITSLNIADAFANAAKKLQENQGDIVNLKEVYVGLGAVAQSIYDLWNKIAFLRDCELGMGLLTKDKKTIGDPIKSKSLGIPLNVLRPYSSIPCDFNVDSNNYTIFSQIPKVLPLITPDGDIWAFGPKHGVLVRHHGKKEMIYFAKNGYKSTSFWETSHIKFFHHKDSKILSSKSGITLYPIPFSAAKGISWKGISFSTNVGSIQSLDKKLKSLEEQLKKLNTWSFSSDNWDENWDSEKYYRQKNIKKQYIGLIEENKNMP